MSAGRPPGGIDKIMMVSVRWPPELPVPSRLRSSADSPSRESDPTSRKVVPGWSAGRSPPGSASTRAIWLQAKTGTAISHNKTTATTMPMTMSAVRAPDRRLRGFGGGGPPAEVPGGAGGGPQPGWGGGSGDCWCGCGCP